MADVIDPYERRGVPHPHEVEIVTAPDTIIAGDGGAVQIEVPPFTAKEKAELKRKLKARDARRIRPGFYTGAEPHDTD